MTIVDSSRPITGGVDTHLDNHLAAALDYRQWHEVTVTILEPLRLSVDPALRGKRRRIAAGALLYTVMSDLIFRTT